MKVICASHNFNDIKGYFNGELINVINQKKMHDNEFLLVGDYIDCEKRQNDFYLINVLPRKNELFRKKNGKKQYLASNIDFIIIFMPLNLDFNMNKLERYYSFSKQFIDNVIILLTKSDLCDNIIDFIDHIKKRINNCKIYPFSIYNENDIIKLKELFVENQVIYLLGNSGAGKSSFINKLLGKKIIKEGIVRKKDDKGKHTTSTRQMYFIPEQKVYIIDNPGIRMINISPNLEYLQDNYSDIFELQKKCKFRNCKHKTEPGCAVKEAIMNGKLDYQMLFNYNRLMEEEEDNNLKKLFTAKSEYILYKKLKANKKRNL